MGEAGNSDVARTTGTGGGSAFGSSDARQALVRWYPMTAEVVKRTPIAAPTAMADAVTPKATSLPLLLQPETGHATAGPESEITTPATPRPNSATEVAARTVSATGAAFEVVHSGGGCASGSGPLV
jgi:hypothetical protein